MVGSPENSLQSNMASPLAFSSSLFKSLFMTSNISGDTKNPQFFVARCFTRPDDVVLSSVDSFSSSNWAIGSRQPCCKAEDFPVPG